MQPSFSEDMLISLSLSRFDEFIAFISGVVIKPAYMILTGYLASKIRKEKAKDLRLFFYSLICFFIGEAVCAVNFYVSSSVNEYLEILHGLGMVCLWIFLLWGFYYFIDERVLHFSDPNKRCGIHGFCMHCKKKEPVICGMEKLFFFTALALVIISIMPLTRPLEPYAYKLSVYDSPVNFVSTFNMQFVEIYVYPVIAIVLLFISAVVIKFFNNGMVISQYLFFPGLGFMLFSMFRFFLTFTYSSNPVWSNFWEETTELIMILGIAVFLWIFKKQLGLGKEV